MPAAAIFLAAAGDRGSVGIGSSAGGRSAMGLDFSRVTLIAAAAAAALGGCGNAARPDADAARTSAPQSRAQRQAAERVRAFLVVMRDKDHAGACAMMTRNLQRAITTELRLETQPGTCHTRAADIYSAAKAPGNADARVTRVRIAGDRATVTVTARSTDVLGTGQVESEVFLVRRADRWRVANF
jgi:hypothetical protein